jgi:hypothetical protein
LYCPQITSWSPQGMRVLRQCTVPRAKVMFVTIQRENISASKEKSSRLLKCLNCPMFAVRQWITTSTYRWAIKSLPPNCMMWTPPPPYCTYTPQGSTRYLWIVDVLNWELSGPAAVEILLKAWNMDWSIHHNISVVKWRKMRWTVCVVIMGEMRNAYKILVVKHEGKRCWRLRRRLEHNINWVLKE